MKQNGIEINGINDFLLDVDKRKLNDNSSLDDKELTEIYMRTVKGIFLRIRENKKYNGCILIGFHPKGWDRFFSDDHQKIIKNKNIKTIVWAR